MERPFKTLWLFFLLNAKLRSARQSVDIIPHSNTTFGLCIPCLLFKGSILLTMTMEVTAEVIARAVLMQFQRLPQKRKPQIRSNSVREWVPLSGIVAQGAIPMIGPLHVKTHG